MCETTAKPVEENKKSRRAATRMARMGLPSVYAAYQFHQIGWFSRSKRNLLNGTRVTPNSFFHLIRSTHLNYLLIVLAAHLQCRHTHWLCTFAIRGALYFFYTEKVNFRNSDNLYEFHINSSGQFLIFAKTKDEREKKTHSRLSIQWVYIFHGPSVTEEIHKNRIICKQSQRHENKLFVCHTLWSRIGAGSVWHEPHLFGSDGEPTKKKEN